MKHEMRMKIEEASRRQPELMGRLLKFLAVARNLERIADYSVNIAEDVIYMVKGAIVRHRGAIDGLHGSFAAFQSPPIAMAFSPARLSEYASFVTCVSSPYVPPPFHPPMGLFRQRISNTELTEHSSAAHQTLIRVSDNPSVLEVADDARWVIAAFARGGSQPCRQQCQRTPGTVPPKPYVAVLGKLLAAAIILTPLVAMLFPELNHRSGNNASNAGKLLRPRDRPSRIRC